VTFKESTDAGDNTISYAYQYGGSAWIDVPDIHTFGTSASHTFPVPGLNYGTLYTFHLKAKNDSYESPESPTVTTTVQGGGASAIYGGFGPPSVSCAGAGRDVNCSWTTGTLRGNVVTLHLSGSPISGDRSGNGNQTVTVGFGQSGTESISASDNHGRSVGGNSSSWQSAPSPSVSIGLGAPTTQGTCSAGDGMVHDNLGCYWLQISMSNFPAGNHHVRCYETMSNNNPAVYYELDHSGNGTFQDCSFSSAGRWVMVMVDGVIYGGNSSPDQCGFAQNNHSPDGYFSGCTPQWPTT
jgi:hypothetical protein